MKEEKNNENGYKTAIVTGATGFLGRNLCKCLIDHGIRVTAVVRSKESDYQFLEMLNVDIVFCDLCNLFSLIDQIQARKNDVLFHLAWEGVTGELRADYDLQVNNIRYALDSVTIAKELGCKRFVGVGSLAEKDVLNYSGMDEATPNLVSHYGAAKIAAHFMTKAECINQGMEYIWCQMANIYGSGDKSQNFVNYAIESIFSHRAQFTSGEQLYDFININDAAEGLFCAGLRAPKNKTYYIGSGHPRFLKEYINIIKDAIDPSITLQLGSIPFNGKSLFEKDYDCRKITQDTGFCAKIPFEIGIKERVDEYKKQNGWEG